MQNTISEASMRRALGLAPKAKRAAYTPGKQVVLSVRKPHGGPVQRFTHKSASISAFEAQLQAERAARENGFEVWALISVGEPE